MMARQLWLVRVGLYAAGALVTAGIMGGRCSGLTIDLPLPGGGSIQFNTVTVELVNTTAYAIEPRLFVDPDDDAIFVDDDENRIFIDPPVAPGQIFTLTLACGRTGAIQTDHAVLLLPFQQNVESDNDPTVRKYRDFECGDVVSFIFIDEVGGDFFTRVEVNGFFITD